MAECEQEIRAYLETSERSEWEERLAFETETIDRALRHDLVLFRAVGSASELVFTWRAASGKIGRRFDDRALAIDWMAAWLVDGVAEQGARDRSIGCQNQSRWAMRVHRDLSGCRIDFCGVRGTVCEDRARVVRRADHRSNPAAHHPCASRFCCGRDLPAGCLAPWWRCGRRLQVGPFKIKVSGRLSGKWRSRGPVQGRWVLVCARVLRWSGALPGAAELRAIHGKEKVYGSIP